MSPTLSVHEVAEAEINEAADFYDLESPGLGGVFLNEIQRAFQSIVEFPAAAPLVRGRVRQRIVTKFPYALVYAAREGEIRILAVAHHKRRPFYWPPGDRRLDQGTSPAVAATLAEVERPRHSIRLLLIWEVPPRLQQNPSEKSWDRSATQMSWLFLSW